MSLQAIKSVDYVVLVCRALREARQFYSEVLGFEIAYEREDWVKFQIGPVSLALRPETDLFSGRTVDGPSLQLAFAVPYSSVDRCYEELLGKGVEIVDAPKDQPWGHRTLYFSDPEGNILEIYAVIDPVASRDAGSFS